MKCPRFALFYIDLQKPKFAFSRFYFMLLFFDVMNALVYLNLDEKWKK